jgi:septal ring factor EnvC (AmiA/AmiB activator)
MPLPDERSSEPRLVPDAGEHGLVGVPLNVQVHDIVQPGDTIGFEGSTGWSTGPHLHFMVELDNVPIDPMPYYGNNRNTITGH